MNSFAKSFNILTLALVLAGTCTGLAQEKATSKDDLSPLAMTVSDLPELRKLSEADLNNFIKVLAATPQIPFAELPRWSDFGGYFSLQHPEWPPLPGNINHEDVWQMEDFYLLNDWNFNYDAPVKHLAPRAKTSSLDPSDPGDGSGDTNSYDFYDNSAASYSTNDLWLQFVTQKNSVSSLVINTPWNVTGSNFMFDVFATTNLLPSVPNLNLTNWMFVTRSMPGQTNLFVSPLPGAPICFYRLGTMQDTDGDGLTDAFEKLVSHTDPNVWDSDGNGIGDGDEISPSGLPWRLMAVRPSSVVIFADMPTATQGGGCGEATVYLPSPAPVGGTIVQYYLGGTASLNSDFTLYPATNQLFIPAGNSYGSITICASGTNTYSDLDLYVDITLTNASGYLVDGTPAHVNIVDTGLPGIRVFALPSWSRRPCTTYGTNVVGFYFIRDGDSTNALTVGLSLSGSTAAVNSEYTSFSTNIIFPANVRTNWLPVTLMADNTNAADKTLAMTITSAPGYQIDPTNGAAILTIAATAAPVLPVVQIAATTPIATTNTPGQFTFTRSFATASPLRVYFHAWNNTNTVISSSTNGDVTTYTALPGYVDIPANSASVNVSLTATRQLSTIQPVVVTLAAGDYLIGTNNAATVTMDAVGATLISINPTRNGVHNGISGWIRPAELTFTRSGSVAAPLTLKWYFQPGGGTAFATTHGQMAGYGDIGQIVWPVGQSTFKTNLTVNYVWNNAGTSENDDYPVFASILFSNANNYFTVPASFQPAWTLVQARSIVLPATVLTNGVSQYNALYLTRPYTRVGIGPEHSLSVVVSAAGSAVNGTDYSMNTAVNFGASDYSVLIPVTALNATNQGWRTLVANIDPLQNSLAVPDAALDTAFVRLANPNNLTTDTDMDGDGIPDGFELSHLANGLDPLTPDNPYEDTDRDGLGIMEELGLGTNPNVADNAPVYPSIEDSDYVPLTMRVGSIGKMLTEPVSSCALCHAVTLRAGNFIATTSKTDWTHNPQIADYIVRLARGTNYPVQVTCNPFASSLLTSNQAAATTSPKYTAAYVAQFLAGNNGVYPFIIDTNKLLGTNLPMVQEVLPKRATLYIPDLTIAADVDRSGVIDFKNRNDRTSATNPFVFWINDDCDTNSDDTATDLDPSANPINSSDNVIHGLRDLEDFARLQFKMDGLPPQFLTNGNYQIKIYVTNVVGTPSLRLFPAADSNGGLGYLTNTTTATAQVNSNSIGVLTNGTPLALPSSMWQTAGQNSFFLPMIFEGISTGSCVITFGFSSNSAPPVAVSRPFYLNLLSATNLYEHWTVGDDNTTDWTAIPNYPTRVAGSAIFGTPKKQEDLDYIVFVHGWRMQPWERRAFASTAYKRMSQLGYKGRFGLYSWPTDFTTLGFWDMTQLNNRRNYDRSERRAWQSALGLWGLLLNINRYEPPYQVRLLAHSMGNIVASEALRLRGNNPSHPPLVQGYIASQAASVAHAYDAANPETINPGIAIFPTVTIPEVYAAFPRKSLSQTYFTGMKNAVTVDPISLAKRTFNFHNRQDFALNSTLSWPVNQASKPDLGWAYLGVWQNLIPYPHNLDLRIDTYEIFSHVAIARSKALGCSETATNVVRGQIGAAIDLFNPPYNFKANSYEHSAEFNSIYVNRRLYWWQVLSSFSLTNNLPIP